MSKSNPKHTPKTWYRLDLSAIVYPTLQRRDFSSVYRLSVLLKDPVQPDILQQAVDIAMKRFPTYHSAMRKGFFWLLSRAEYPSRSVCKTRYPQFLHADAV